METNNKKNRPEVIRIGKVKAAIWKHEAEGGRTRFSVTVSKLYRTKDNRWDETKSFDRDDLPVLGKVIDEVFMKLVKQPSQSDLQKEVAHVQ